MKHSITTPNQSITDTIYITNTLIITTDAETKQNINETENTDET